MIAKRLLLSREEFFCLPEVKERAKQMGATHCSYYIKYYPEFKRVFGSEKAALIFERLEYWSQKYESGFWKFFEPCPHPLYRQGDSWEEEVGFSRKVFKRFFSLIGTHYASKSEFLKQGDPFQGKLYASYYDRKTNRTYFLRNHDAVNTFFKNLWNATKKVFSQKERGGEKKGRSRNVLNGSSFAHAYKDIYSNKEISSSPPCPQSPEPPQDMQEKPPKGELTLKILKSWHETVEASSPEKTPLTFWREKALKKSLKESFGSDLSQWKAYCERIAANTFLMGGGARGWSATLDWALRAENIQKVREGAYTGQKEASSESLERNRPLREEEIQGPEAWKSFCLVLSHVLGSATVRAWFKEVTPIDFEGKSPKIQCRSAFQRSWIQRNFSQALEQVSRKLFPEAQLISIVG